jgi:uncharacterized membrane protein YphA (DoxX/SURF4 family)
MDNRELGVALLVLRLGAGVFLLLFGLDKLVATGMAQEVYAQFYGLAASAALVRAAGVLEILLGLAILAGLWKTLSYGLGLALHAISTVATWRELLAPFGDNHLFLAALPTLAAFVALFLLRRRDTLWSVARAAGRGDG